MPPPNDDEEDDTWRVGVSHGEPHDDITKVADWLSRVLENEHPHMKAVIMLDDDQAQKGGMVFHGYEDRADFMRHFIRHLRAIVGAQERGLLEHPGD